MSPTVVTRMNEVGHLLAKVRSMGMTLWTEQGELCIRAPKGTMTAAIAEELRGSKAELIALLEKTRDMADKAEDKLPVIDREAHLPLSFGQQRFWFLAQIGESANAMPTALHLEGSLDITALQRAIQALFQRHEVLRTTFPAVQGQPVVTIADHYQPDLAVLDLNGVADEARDRILTAFAQLPFELDRLPLFRFCLLRLHERSHVLAVSLHHIISDGWSVGVMIRELVTCYQAHTSGRPYSPAPLPVQYVDFAAWQRDRLQGELLDGLWRFWHEQLAQLPDNTSLPLDRPRPAQQRFLRDKLSFTLDESTLMALRALGRGCDATLFMVLQSCVYLLLRRHSRSSDIVLGSPGSNRNREALEPLIGFFVNTLVLRMRPEDCEGRWSFEHLLRYVRDVNMAALGHADLPFDHLVEKLNPERHLNRHPLFQVMFSLQGFSAEDMSLPGLDLKTRLIEEPVSAFDLRLDFQERARDLLAVITYDTDLYYPETIARLENQFQRLIASIIADPAQSVARLLLPDEETRTRLLTQWNHAPYQEWEAEPLHRLFEAQVTRTPDALALRVITKEGDFEDLTYRELDLHGNFIALRLQELGVIPGDLVGLFLQRSIELYAGILGILKAGAGYLPLDPENPRDRLAFMLDDANPRVILCLDEAELPSSQASLCCPRRPASDGAWHAPTLDVSLAHRAYVMYTSGSTGKPKGIQVSHEAIANRVLWAREAFPLETTDSFLQIAGFGFDISLWEFLAPLLAGARSVAAPPDAHRDPHQLLNLIAAQKITVAHFVPSLLSALLLEGNLERAAGLRLVFCGGEALPASLRQRFLQQFDATLFHFYGPTEAAINMTSWDCREPLPLDRKPPIGRPITQMEAYVLDDHLEPVAPGVCGALYLGGIGLAQGYLGRPALTAARFIPHPFDKHGERLYESGDLARFDHEGNLLFEGRVDFQVKIRGKRIEPGEIEAVLCEHKAVSEVVVVVREDRSGSSVLVAYAVLHEDASPEPDLRTYAVERLPEYMVPLIVVLERLPLNANGKLDRGALPKSLPEQSGQEDSGRLETATETSLAAIWTEVLGTRGFGRDENFFELGGHSLLATRVASRIREVFQIDFSVRTVFEANTLGEQASAVDRTIAAGIDEVLPLVRVSRDQALPLSFSQQRLWFLDQLGQAGKAYHIPFVIRFDGALCVRALEGAIGDIIARHEALRTHFTVHEGQPMAVFGEPAPCSLALIDISKAEVLREAALLDWLKRFSAVSFDLTRGPLVRQLLLRLGPQSHVLAVTKHHIVSDGWSVAVMGRELVHFYTKRVLAQRNATPLPDLSIQYADYAYWQQHWLATGQLQSQRDYWVSQLQGAPELMDLPTDRPRPPLQTFSGGREKFVLDAAFRAKVEAACRHYGATPFMLLQTAFALLLSRYSGLDDVVTGTPIANRHRRELEPLIGFFVNTLALRVDLTGNPNLVELLDRVRQTLLDAYAHQDLPFEEVVKALQPKRDLSHLPLFQHFFMFQNATTEHLSMPGLRIHPLNQEQGTIQFDLSLGLQEKQGCYSGTLDFNQDLFDRATVVRLVGHFESLLSEMLAKPEQPQGDWHLLGADDRRTMLHDWNQTRKELGPDWPLHRFVEAQVARTPERVALIQDRDGDVAEHWSYAHLNEQANRLARLLLHHGARQGSLVGVHVRRSPSMVVALLATLKAGCAYVPFEPDYPTDRITYMLADCGSNLLLTETCLRDRFSDLAATVLCLDTDELLDGYADHDLNIEIDAAQLAYVIYTSGSTGRPKGVMVPHHGIVNHVLWMQDAFPMIEEDRVIHKTVISFDVAGTEIYNPLIAGASMVIVPDGAQRDPHYLIQAMLRHRVTRLNLVPTLLGMLLGDPDFAGLTSLTHIFSGGEALTGDLFRRLDQILDVELVNLYGPTEASIDTHFQVVSDDHAQAVVPIGGPLSNTRVYIVDAHGNPQPVGVPGELCLAGANLARGYLDRPTLTAEKFIPDPFAEEPGLRMYRSGDLARFLANGTVMFMGRKDHQVKLRGFRIECGEIEQMLVAHEDVSKALVTVANDQTGEQRLVAYLVMTAGSPDDDSLQERLTDFLGADLPDYMVPGAFVRLAEMPLTPNGKVDRTRLPQPKGPSRSEVSGALAETRLERMLTRIWQELLGLERVGIHENFMELGGHSLLVARMKAKLDKLLTRPPSIVGIFQYPTIHSLARHIQSLEAGSGLATRSRKREEQRSANPTDNREIAIIGMALRFPGANSPDAFWQNLVAGVESIRHFTDEELLAAGVSQSLLNHPNYVRAGVELEGIDRFDAAFFGIPPKEAQIIDPQHRLFLETAWHALENASYSPGREELSVGVFAGVGFNVYLPRNLLSNPELTASVQGLQGIIANDKDFLTSRVSYKLNLAGPSVAVQTACSTSLVAVHLAAKSLLDRECDMALAGGVSLKIKQDTGYLYEADSINSPDGHCRAFDARAGGCIQGSGTGCVVLKRLSHALEDGDHIYAVIKGSAINNDGSQKIGYTAPGVDGQVAVIADALQVAGVEADSIGYVEAHGTGTALGDPVEITALTQAYAGAGITPGTCAIGSVKTNFGHLDTAAGVAGLIKAALILQRGQIPASLHFASPNPKIDFRQSPFYVNNQLVDWPKGPQPRRAGVSSFGIGGTNAHVILEEPPARQPSQAPSSPQLLPLSAKSETALRSQAIQLADHLEANPQLSLGDVAYTLSVGRNAFEYRQFVVCADRDEAVKALREGHGERAHHADRRPSPVFLFPGQGCQYVSMASQLYREEPVFKEHLDHCFAILEEGKRPLLADARDLLFCNASEQAAQRLAQTRYTQPLLFSVEYALARLWMAWGVQPDAMIGHSLGEYVAAHLAGVFSLRDALTVVCARGSMMQRMPVGAMLAVNLGEDELHEYLNHDLSLAAENTRHHCVVSGPVSAIEQLHQALEAKAISCTALHTSHAFHSPMMEPMLEAFAQQLGAVELHPPGIPFISNVTGSWITEREATDPTYWVNHLRQTVRFARGLNLLLQDAGRLFLEVGPGKTLSQLVRAMAPSDNHPMLRSLPHPRENRSDVACLLESRGRLWLAGVPLVETSKGLRQPLPGYPFEHKRFWIEPGQGLATPKVDAAGQGPADGCYVPVWKSGRNTSPKGENGAKRYLFFVDKEGLARDLILQLDTETVVVEPGTAFASVDQTYAIDPENPADYRRLFEELAERSQLPDTLVYCWGISESMASPISAGFTYLVRAMEGIDWPHASTLNLIGDQTQCLPGDTSIHPEKAFGPGLLRMISRRLPQVTCRAIDVALPGAPLLRQRLVASLAQECRSPIDEPMVAFRGVRRFSLHHEACHLAKPAPGTLPIRQGGTYLISGPGSSGSILAEHLVDRYQANLVLLADGRVPGQAPWDPHTISRLKAFGTWVHSIEVESDADLIEIRHRMGPIHGVIHAAPVSGDCIGLLGSITEDESTEDLLDFVVLCASLNSDEAETFEEATTAAYLDAFAHFKTLQDGTLAVSIVWEAASSGLSPQDMVDLFERALASGEAQVIVSKHKDRPLIASNLHEDAEDAAEVRAVGLNRHARPKLDTAYVAPATSHELHLAAIWESCFGIEGIGVDDVFFDLGGDSLLAGQILSRARETFDCELAMSDLFEFPTLAGLAGLITSREGASAQEDGPIQPTARPEKIPLSFAQQRLWFLDQLNEQGNTYNVPANFSFEGPLDVAILERCLGEVLARHEALRTSFPAIDGQPVQRIAPFEDFQLSIHDVAHLNEETRTNLIERSIDQIATKPFDLAEGPLFRMCLLRLARNEHIFMLAMHHIISDGWSAAVMIGEVVTLYTTFLSDKDSAPKLPPLPIQYADFAIWQRRRLSDEVLERQRAYWTAQLKDIPAIVELPTDRPRPAVMSGHGATERFHLPASLSAQARQAARRSGTTLFMFQQAVFAILLARYSGQRDIVLGSSVASRNRRELEPLIGFFVNILALRTRLDGNPSFAQILDRVRRTTLDAFSHQDLPFEQVVDCLQLERSLSHSPVFQVLFEMQNLPAGGQHLPGLALKNLTAENATAKFDLNLAMEEDGDRLQGTLEYNTVLFDRSTILRLMRHYQTLMEEVVADPSQSIFQLPLLASDERDMILMSWNDTDVAFPDDVSFAPLFEAIVARVPDAPALLCEDRSLTYRELNQRANRLAHFLAERGVGIESIVSILGYRDLDFWTMMLAILKRGAVYLPMDPMHPAGRIHKVLEQSGTYLAVSTQAFRDVLEEAVLDLPNPPDLCFMDELDLENHSPENFPTPVGGSHLAYVIFTSGSTGTPKGAMVTHVGMVNHLYAEIQDFGLTANDVVAQNSTQSFDVSVWQFLNSFMVGGQTRILSEDAARNPICLLDEAEKYGVTVLEMVPTQLQVIVEESLRRGSQRPLLQQMRLMICNGEVLHPELCRQWFALFPHMEVINAWGLTECSDDQTQYHIYEPPPLDTGSLPIGYPLQNMTIYILDAHLQPQPIGVTGTLYVGGICVGRGYLNRPALTAGRFIPDPFGGKPGTRLYNTGDLARYLPDGAVDFLGRVDFQVKVRGFRIELGEIESRLIEHPLVREAVVLAKAKAGGPASEKRLVAYLTIEQTPLSRGQIPARLRAHVLEKLPEYMVPSAFVLMDHFPQTSSGKINRNVLPEPKEEDLEMAGREHQPSTPTEETLARIWTDLLEVSQFDLQTNFFNVGGHSLLAIRLTSRIRASFDVDLPLRTIFQKPTIAALAREIKEQKLKCSGIIPRLVPQDRSSRIPLSYAQQRIWFTQEQNPDSNAYNLPFAFELSGRLATAALAKAFATIIDRHETLRTTYPMQDDLPGQVIREPGCWSLPIVDLTGLTPESQKKQLDALVAADAGHVFDLHRETSIRITLIKLAPQGHMILCNLHHIAADGWAIGVFIDELVNLYRTFLDEEPVSMADLEVGYADFAIWQHRWLSGEAFHRELSYWEKQLAGIPPVQKLPTSKRRSSQPSHQVGHHKHAIPTDSLPDLKQLEQEKGITQFMTLLAVFDTLLFCHTGEEDVVVGTDVAGREFVEVEKMIGMFVNQLVLRTSLADDPSFETILDRVRVTTLDAYAHQNMPFDKLVSVLNPPRDKSITPLFQVKLVLQNVPESDIELPGVMLRNVGVPTENTKFDLLVNVQQTSSEFLLSLDYNADLFDTCTIEQLTRHFTLLWQRAVAEPTMRLSEFKALLTESEREAQAIEKEALNQARASRIGKMKRRVAIPSSQT